jgi:hypothetical protein
MNTARYAKEILNAWQIGDWNALRDALARALQMLRKVKSISRLDQEREEMLQSVISELQQLDRQHSLPTFTEASGTAVLLEHLSSFPFSEQISGVETSEPLPTLVSA